MERIGGAGIPLKPTAETKAAREDIELRRACREFESYLVSMMLKSMRTTVPKTDLFGSADKQEIFQSMLDDEVGRKIAERGAFGLADFMYRQLSASRTHDLPPPLLGKEGRWNRTSPGPSLVRRGDRPLLPPFIRGD